MNELHSYLARPDNLEHYQLRCSRCRNTPILRHKHHSQTYCVLPLPPGCHLRQYHFLLILYCSVYSLLMGKETKSKPNQNLSRLGAFKRAIKLVDKLFSMQLFFKKVTFCYTTQITEFPY